MSATAEQKGSAAAVLGKTDSSTSRASQKKRKSGAAKARSSRDGNERPSLKKQTKSQEEIEASAEALQVQLAKEQEILEHLLKLEKEMREHYLLHEDEAQKQCVAVDRIWLLTQRYLIICNPPCSQHEAFYPKPTEHVILEEYNEKMLFVRTSNCHIFQSIVKLRESCLIFENLCSQLDMTMETPFVLGNTYHQPLSFFIELVADLFKYMHALLLKMKYSCALFEPTDLSILEDYKKLLKPNEDFYEYLHMGLTYCRCLQKKPLCPEKTERFPCLKKL